jgi:hypothetical protein
MKVLNGWKEIADCLHRTPRSARRWERLGLPVWRLSNSTRSPVVAYEHEIQDWIRRRKQNVFDRLAANTTTFRVTYLETIKLTRELNNARTELRRQLDAIATHINRERPRLG